MSAFTLLLFIGLFFRILLIGNPGFEADISFWKSWSLGAVDHGIVWASHNTNINYPPGFIYVLWLMGKIYALIGDPHNFQEYWQVNNFKFLVASKSIAIASDILIAILIYWFFNQKEKLKRLGANTFNLKAGDTSSGPASDRTRKLGLLSYLQNNLPLVLAAAFYLNPAVILDSALWGQVESFGILFTLLAIMCIFYNRISLAAALFTIGCLMKLQNIIYIPLFFLFIYRYHDMKGLVKSVAASSGAFFLLTLPFILANDMLQVLWLLTINSDFFPWLSLNAHNIWWIVAGAKGMQVTDKITVLGMLNAKSVGLYMFAASYLYCMIILYKKPTARNLFYTLSLGIFSFFLLTTESHERYSYPVVVFLLFLYPFLENYFTVKGIKYTFKKFFWILYTLFTVAVFFNMHTGLILNYPNNGFATITKLTTPIVTILSSWFHIVLYFLLIPLSLTQVPPVIFLICLGVLGILIFLGNATYLISGKVPLNKYIPVVQKQDFGILQINKSTNSFGKWRNWSRLSDDYFFYRRGIGTHANATHVFDINRLYSRFTTDFGIDTEAPTPASAIFKIYGDDRILFESKIMGRFDFPAHADVNIKGVKHLKLEITDAGDGINSDHADWLNPILYK